MASSDHDFIVTLVARKISSLGFEIIFIEGQYCSPMRVRRMVPPRVVRHRPDVVGANLDGSYCIGEAKTKDDIRTARSREQLEDYATFLADYPLSMLVVGCPHEASWEMTSLMLACGLHKDGRVHLLFVPGPLLPSRIAEDDV
jgi:hypothetical protein